MVRTRSRGGLFGMSKQQQNDSEKLQSPRMRSFSSARSRGFGGNDQSLISPTREPSFGESKQQHSGSEKLQSDPETIQIPKPKPISYTKARSFGAKDQSSISPTRAPSFQRSKSMHLPVQKDERQDVDLESEDVVEGESQNGEMSTLAETVVETVDEENSCVEQVKEDVPPNPQTEISDVRSVVESRNDEVVDPEYTEFDSFHDRLCGIGICSGQEEKTSSEPLLDDGSVFNDDQSVSSVSTVGRYFSDLVSLPSLGFDAGNDDMSFFSMGSISSVTGAEINLAPPSDFDLGFFQFNGNNANDILKVDSMTGSPVDAMEGANPSDCVGVDVDVEVDVDEAICVATEVASKKPSEAAKAGTEEALNTNTRRQLLCEELRQTMDTHGRYDIRCANIAGALGDLFFESDEHDQALQVYEEAISIYSSKLGDHHVTTLDCKIRFGKLLEKYEDYDKAIETFFQVMSMRQSINGPKTEGVAEMLFLISKILSKKKNQEQAIKEMKRALKIYRETLSDSHPKAASCVDEIARSYMQTGETEKAAAILEEVVKLRAATSGVNNKEVAGSLLELGAAHEANQDFDKAMKSFKKAYSIYRKLDGDKSVEGIDALEHIALCYQSMGEKDKAITALVGVLRTRKAILGDRDRLVAKTFVRMGTLLRQERHFQKALRCIKHALSIYVGEGKDMEDVAQIADSLHEMALIHQSKGYLGDVVKVLKQEVAIRQKMGKPELPRVVKTLNRLGMTELSLKNSKGALKHFMEALAICEKKEGMEMDFGETLLNTGLALKDTGHKERANEAFVEAFKIFKKLDLKGDHQLVKDTVREMKHMERTGHSCACKGSKCREVPCISLY